MNSHEPVIRLPEPLPQQDAPLDSPGSRKVMRCGRRWSKSRFAMIASIAGHGPGWRDGQPKFPGILQGGDVVWCAQDYPQLTTVMWREEFTPRFKHLPFVDMNERDMRLTVDGLGSLFLRPETAINGIRGIGKNLKGVVLDEAAFYDLKNALLDVILPALMDNEGWLIIMSTTNADMDGNADKRVPSYFNIICEEIEQGLRTPDWVQFTGTAFDNPRISRKAIQELLDEYKDSPLSRDQEVYAKLISGGVGRYLTMLDWNVHKAPISRVPSHWPLYGALDWGYDHPFVFHLYTVDEDGNPYCVDRISGRRKEPDEIGAMMETFVGGGMDRLHWVVAGTDIWAEKGKSIGHHGPTIAETIGGYGFTLIRAKTDKTVGGNRMRRLLGHDLAEGREPQMRFFDTPGARAVFDGLGRLLKDPNDTEKMLKVDANPETGLGGDDDADAFRYFCMSRPQAATPQVTATDEDTLTAARLRKEARQTRRPLRGPDPSTLPPAVTWAADPSKRLIKPAIPGMDPEDARNAATFTLTETA